MAKKDNNGGELVVPEQQSTAVAVPADLIGRLSVYAKTAQKTEAVGGQFFGTKAGVLTFNKTPIPGNAMDVVIVRSMFERTYYPTAFNADQYESPLCFGFDHNGYADMVPHANATEQQATACAMCKFNEWTPDLVADPSGKKARVPCKQIRRLACLPVSAVEDPAKITAATIGYLRVPVTSTKFWSAYAQVLAAQDKPSFMVVTKVALFPDVKNQVRYEFSKVRDLTDGNVLLALEQRFLAEEQVMAFPYEKRQSRLTPLAATPQEQQEQRKF